MYSIVFPPLVFAILDACTYVKPPKAADGSAPAPPPPSLVSLLLSSPTALMRSRFMQWFATITMPFYMIHGNVYDMIWRWVPYFPGSIEVKPKTPGVFALTPGAQCGVAFVWLGAIVLITGLAWATNKYYEVPAAKLMHRLLLPKPKPAADKAAAAPAK
eukprot:4399302-Prymnesium_polylepis.1